MITINIKDMAELVMLAKALYHTKYFSESPDVWRLAGSPIFAELVSSVFKQYYEIRNEPPPFLNNSWPLIEDSSFDRELDNIKSNLCKVDEWLDLDKEDKVIMVKYFIIPFNYTSQTINNIIEQTDRYHDENKV